MPLMPGAPRGASPDSGMTPKAAAENGFPLGVPSMPEAMLPPMDELAAMPLGGDGKDSPEGTVKSGVLAFLRALFVGDESEQKPDRGLIQCIRDLVRNRGKDAEGNGPMGDSGPGGPASGPAPGANPGLFAAMDAPLHGLTPDDIQFAGEVDAALARRPRFGVRALSITVAVMFVCLLTWAAFAKIDEVTHAEGQVVGSQRTQTIQNLEGGILRSVQVHEGQIVEKGDVLAQLDNELAESSYRDAVNKAMENSLAIIRLEAELKDQRPVFPEDLRGWAAKLIGHAVDDSTLARARQIIRDQENAWQSRQNQLNAEIEVLKSQYEQRRRDVEEQAARKTQLARSLALSIEQRDTAYALVQRNNFSRMEYLGLQQKVVELQGQIDMLAASIPKAQAAADESRQRIASRRAEQNAAITEEINKRRLELNSLRETLSAGSDRVTRTELRTPVRGTVKQIYINTVGGVVKPGEPIMDIVPLDDTLLVEAKVSPKDVAFLRPGQDVMVKVSAYDFSIYGGLEGKLESISADTIEDKKGNYHYLVKVRTQKTAITYHNEVLPIIPGMIVTADILIGKKTVLDYLLKPILKAKQNALRER
ncbi:MAG: HlyD family type I secretion periplasmic adaptor subunit [Desulfovibrio sp.]|uniref:HlyD family type I secretion periplasmic adaptor subunit n=1 Tax=Desulfovibrio sp. TaxID=885 RepID=UPI00258967DD|nr:HlyD family type I secretion periplasmic adaptor subunit [Desulfovibrio sp.]MCD7982790.1 HlyD family type I secretion periplasmic adaptor subunit [Desulfovibrio sp.]